jgi:hypothetical protein
MARESRTLFWCLSCRIPYEVKGLWPQRKFRCRYCPEHVVRTRLIKATRRQRRAAHA